MARILTGKIISTKMAKTVVVQIETKIRHPLYKKVLTRRKKIKAHSVETNLQEGDIVKIKETKPMAKDKHFIVLKKVK